MALKILFWIGGFVAIVILSFSLILSDPNGAGPVGALIFFFGGLLWMLFGVLWLSGWLWQKWKDRRGAAPEPREVSEARIPPIPERLVEPPPIPAEEVASVPPPATTLLDLPTLRARLEQVHPEYFREGSPENTVLRELWAKHGEELAFRTVWWSLPDLVLISHTIDASARKALDSINQGIQVAPGEYSGGLQSLPEMRLKMRAEYPAFFVDGTDESRALQRLTVLHGEFVALRAMELIMLTTAQFLRRVDEFTAADLNALGPDFAVTPETFAEGGSHAATLRAIMQGICEDPNIPAIRQVIEEVKRLPEPLAREDDPTPNAVGESAAAPQSQEAGRARTKTLQKYPAIGVAGTPENGAFVAYAKAHGEGAAHLAVDLLMAEVARGKAGKRAGTPGAN